MICGFKKVVYFNLSGEYSFWAISQFIRNMSAVYMYFNYLYSAYTCISSPGYMYEYLCVSGVFSLK